MKRGYPATFLALLLLAVVTATATAKDPTHRESQHEAIPGTRPPSAQPIRTAAPEVSKPSQQHQFATLTTHNSATQYQPLSTPTSAAVTGPS